MSDTMWNLPGDMHGNNAAAHTDGQDELEDPIKSLLDDPGATPLALPGNSASELPDDLIAETQSMNPLPNPSQSINPPASQLTNPPARLNCSNLPPLSDAQLAPLAQVDSPSPPPAYESIPAQATWPTPSRATRTASVGAIPAATGSGVMPSTWHPLAKSGAPAH
ncbi:uncharacterized protein PGTG_09097 [Puccinia graminis f. sp. tritici CRL 75-36-700-3]|uniref:Uncharacterized protein n=1 Tax=Puccinia graminis f. sp. tritici (strain CRL 75-36-700-3 / race SCCL) TaxID=418459 RepID=E3KFY1_PUCGT|nr:uncharacterized protein PGTG_09097 [Puccinia graminis f. sp. tritici CRL 75-36-700-3]EFP83144.2 hypothetical protein PGTG_09097 [Puccinia graminis f. sp. tritici CRL 75-36-700-3]